jgi:hypothetical protein
MKIIDNRDGVARGKIYNIGNPRNNFSVRELAEMMVELALEIPEYAKRRARCARRTTAERYYGAATRTCRTACRRSTTPCATCAGARASACATRCAASTTPIAPTSPRLATWSE